MKKHQIEQLVAFYLRLSNVPTADRDDRLIDYIYDIDPDFDGEETAILAQIKATIASGTQVKPANGAAHRKRSRIGQTEWTAEHEKLRTAPYRFVSLGGKVALTSHNQPPPALNKPCLDRFSVKIDVEWKAETPLLIGDYQTEVLNDDRAVEVATPFQLGSDYVIPGASIRGLLRSTLEALAFGRLYQTNRHARFGLRDFDHPHYRAFMQGLLEEDGQKAGWLEKVAGSEGQYKITPCDWGYVRIDALLQSRDGRRLTSWIESNRKSKYGQLQLDWQSTNAFRTPWKFKHGEQHSSHAGKHIWQPNAGDKVGYPVFTGAVPGRGGPKQKVYEYVFFEDQREKPTPLCNKTWEVFEIANCKPSKNKRMPDGAWADFAQVVEIGGRVPVFYVGDLSDQKGSDFSFGLTRLYRLPHRSSIGDVVKRDHEAHDPSTTIWGEGAEQRLQPDFVEALFGYVFEPDDLGLNRDHIPPSAVARRGRVAFGFARASAGFELWPSAEKQPIATVVGSPKPSFGPFYLIGPDKDYSASVFQGQDGRKLPQIAGRKRYLPRHNPSVSVGDGADELRQSLEQQLTMLRKATKSRDTSKVESHLRFLRPTGENAVFRGEIRLHNVSKAELGAVLWALTFGGDAIEYRHMLGRARAFGAGQMQVSDLSISTKKNILDAGWSDAIHWQPSSRRAGIESLLCEFEDKIALFAGFSDREEWKKSEPVKGLLAASRPVGWNADGTAYLPYMSDNRQAGHFQELRKSASSGGAPTSLLEIENVVTNRRQV